MGKYYHGRKLSSAQAERLGDMARRGVELCYRVKRKVYSTRYVEMFSVQYLLEEGCFPKYWYKGPGITANKAEKDGAERL